MKPTPYPSNKTKPWRVSVPGRFFANRKRKAYYFADKKAATEFCTRVRRYGLSAVREGPRPSEAELKQYEPQVLEAINRLGGDPAKLWQAVANYERLHLSVKPADVGQAIAEFNEIRKKKVAARTHKGDRWRLKPLLNAFEYKPISELTETDLRRFFDRLKGHTRSVYKTTKVFFRWAKEYGYLTVDPMAGIRPTEDWGTRKGIYPVATFERMLRIAAGLEGPLPGEQPTKRFLPLLPWFALSGFCGLRSCEAYPSFLISDGIRWGDLYFERGFIEIRESVAKITRKTSDGRFIETPRYLEALKAWLEFVPREIGFIVPIRSRYLTRLKSEFTRATGIKFLENGFRNSFASYALSVDGKEGVGKLALEMGNSESVARRYYIKTLEPRTGKAWFSLRPEGAQNVIAINAA